MKFLLLSISLGLLNGCMWQSVDSNDIRLGTILCAEEDGIHHITEQFTSITRVRCNNGKEYFVK